MSYAERTYRTLRVCLLIFALTAVVWPETNYNARLQLQGEVAVPTSAAKATSGSSVLFRSEASHEPVMMATIAAAPLTIRYLKRQTSVYAAIPTYPEALVCALDQTERVDPPEASRYASQRVSPPTDRGPPIFV